MYGNILQKRLLRHNLLFFSEMCFILLLLSAIEQIGPVVDAQACTSIPISLSNLQSCEDNICTLKQSVVAAIPLHDNANLCFDLVPPDSVGSAYPINITLSHSHLIWDMDYSYYTDSPKVVTKGYCGCPGGNSVHCPNCLNSHVTADIVLCASGTHKSKQCPLDFLPSESGTWCTNTGISGNKRFRILRVTGEFEKDFELEIHDPANTWAFGYDGTIINYYADDLPINVTILTDTSVVKFTPEFIVYDMHDPSDFYFLTSSEVNGLDGYDPNKIGWFKVDKNKKVSPGLGELIQHTIKSCDDNKFNNKYPWFNLEDYLHKRRTRLSQALSPGAVLLDPKFRPKGTDGKSDPQHNVNPYAYLEDGWMTTDSYGYPMFMGIIETDLNHASDYSPKLGSTDGLNRTILTNNGLKTRNDWLISSNSIIDVGNSAKFATLMVSPDFKDYGVCVYTSGWDCINGSIYATTWPDFATANLSFDGNFRKEILEDTGETADPLLITEVENGILEVLIEFNNFTIVFESTVIKPKINSVVFDGNNLLVVNAQSTTVGGTCYVGTVPADLIITQALDLGVSPSDFELTLEKSSFSGTAKVQIQCYKNVASKDLKLSYDITTEESDFEEDTSTNNNVGLWESINPVELDDAFSDMWNLDSRGRKWYHYLLTALEVVVIVVIGVALIIALYKGAIWIKNRRKSDPMSFYEALRKKHM